MKLRPRKGRLTDDQVAKLEDLTGWTWENKSESQWQRGFQALSKYIVKHGDAAPKTNYKDPDGYPLGRWVAKQRQTKQRMPEVRRELLESLQGWRWARERR